MFNLFIGLVTSPQIAIDAVNMCTCFGEVENFPEDEISIWINDIINFHIDMLMGRGN